MISQSVVCIYMHVANVPAWACCCAVVIHMQWLYIVLEHWMVEVFSNWIIFFAKTSWGLKTQKCSWFNFFFRGGGGGILGAPHAPTRGSRGVGKRYTSSYDHDIWPVKILERSRLGSQKLSSGNLGGGRIKKKFWQNHKAFLAGSRECLISKFMEDLMTVSDWVEGNLRSRKNNFCYDSLQIFRISHQDPKSMVLTENKMVIV